MNELSVLFPKSLEITLNKSESETISAIKEIVALHLSKNGTISLTDSSGAELKMDAENSEITVEDANGNIMTMNSSGTKVEDSNGNVIEMAAAGITADAPKVVVKAGP